MFGLNSLTQVFRSSNTVDFDDDSKIVLISDCHRGDGTYADGFLKNQSIYNAALEHYYTNNYTYIEIGDGDELWENKSMSAIVNVHKDTFMLLTRFYSAGRFMMIYGNHDIVKKKYQEKRVRVFRYCDASLRECVSMFQNMPVYEGVVLDYKKTGDKILLAHGHQADMLNSTLWKLARFLVRHLWRPLELIGINDPTSASKNGNKKESVESKLADWTIREKTMLIAGHTHKTAFPKPGQPLYFNDGCCVHPNGINAIEIADGSIQLVRWYIKTKTDGVLFVGKETAAGPVRLADYFTASHHY
jgi:UDP-2,3-diacylglucosamine pyrophosphatase LpxH